MGKLNKAVDKLEHNSCEILYNLIQYVNKDNKENIKYDIRLTINNYILELIEYMKKWSQEQKGE